MPAAGGLRRHAQLAGDLGTGLALGEQLGGLHAAAFQPLQVSRVPRASAKCEIVRFQMERGG
jgi:hypothetical protein